MEFEVVWGENLELENGVNGGGEEEEEAEQQRERREGIGGVPAGEGEKGGVACNYQNAPPTLFHLFLVQAELYLLSLV